MSINCIEDTPQVDSLSDRLTDTLHWMGISIAKIVVVAGVIIRVFLDPSSVAAEFYRSLAKSLIEIVLILGVCKGLKEIFFSAQGNVQNQIPKPIGHAIPLS